VRPIPGNRVDCVSRAPCAYRPAPAGAPENIAGEESYSSPSGGGLWPPRRLPFQLESRLIRL
jgi:hypothetical protein